MATESRPNFSSFPSDEHFKNVCKQGPGREGCRYSSMTVSNGKASVTCEKYGSLRNHLDERVKADTIRSKGDNCAGILGLINDNQSALVGNKTRYKEVFPTAEGEGIFKSLKIEGNMVIIEAGDSSLAINKDDIQIDVDFEGISFTSRTAGYLVGEAKILFEKPQVKQT